MGLKQNIVVVNEYTIKAKNSSKGSRGGTPGDYVLRYMARKGAVEDVTPVRLQDTDAYIVRYMARAEATETLSSVGEIKKGMKEAEGLGGVAFSRDDISMSDEGIRRKSKQIQAEFDKGKTVLKTVVSFDTEYLRKMGIIPEDFELKQDGDLRGNVDQMKMRLAITNGMKRLGSTFDDLDWVGTLQVDTGNLHCHLCMVDKGRGTLTKDGTQKGKLSDNQMRMMRRGIDLSLDRMHPVKQMASNITHDKRNAKCFIKRFTHEAMSRNSAPQFLLACLPEDKRLWRASTNNKEMQKANALVREYVVQVLNEPNSGYKEAMRDIYKYAEHRQKDEGLSVKDYRKLVEQGENRLISDCMNSVYAVLKQIPDEERRVKTPMLDVMSRDYEVLASEVDKDPMLEFGFKLRSYANRLDHHKKEKSKYREARISYETAKEKNQVADSSKPLYDFYKFEEEYNAKLMCKYQHFLSFLPPKKEYEDEFKELMDYKDKLRKMEFMTKDSSMRQMYADNAENYGREVYGHHGGRFAVIDPQVLEARLVKMQDTYEKKEEAFRDSLANYGLTLSASETKMSISKEKPYEFQDVKALDIHHLLYDFPYNVAISKINVDEFIACAKERHTKFQSAYEYLQKTGQTEYIKQLPQTDIQVMRELADALSKDPVLPTRKTSSSGKSSVRGTIRLDVDYNKNLKLAVKSIIETEREFGE